MTAAVPSAEAASPPATVYRVSRLRAAKYLAMCAAWIAFAWWQFGAGLSNKSTPLGLLGMIVGGAYGFANLMVMVSPTRLTLTDDGFQIDHWTAREHVAWTAIDPLWVVGRGMTAMVAYKYASGELPPGAGWLHKLNHLTGAFDGSLPGSLPIAAGALCREMNERRARVVRKA